MTADQLRALINYDPATGVFTTKDGKIATGSPSVAGYLRVAVAGERHYAHRLAWLYVTGKWPEGDTDHINRNKADNRFENLRDVGRVSNAQNRLAPNANSSSGFLGVSWSKAAKKWAAGIKVDGRRRHLGLFETPQEAHAAYLTSKMRLHDVCVA